MSWGAPVRRTIPEHPRAVASRLVGTAVRAVAEAVETLDTVEADADGLASRDRLSGLVRQLEKEANMLRRPDRDAAQEDPARAVRFAE